MHSQTHLTSSLQWLGEELCQYERGALPPTVEKQLFPRNLSTSEKLTRYLPQRTTLNSAHSNTASPSYHYTTTCIPSQYTAPPIMSNHSPMFDNLSHSKTSLSSPAAHGQTKCVARAPRLMNPKYKDMHALNHSRLGHLTPERADMLCTLHVSS